MGFNISRSSSSYQVPDPYFLHLIKNKALTHSQYLGHKRTYTTHQLKQSVLTKQHETISDKQSRSAVSQSVPLPTRDSCLTRHFKTSLVISHHTYAQKTSVHVRNLAKQVAVWRRCPSLCNRAGSCVMGDADFETINQKQLHEWTDTQEGLD